MARRSKFASQLKKYVQNTQEVRSLSTVNVAKLKSSRDYAETLRDNFTRIRELALENREILSGVLEPVLASKDPLPEDQVQALREFKQELLDAYSVENLDLPIMVKTVTRLYRDAYEKGELSYMIEQMDSQVEAYYALSCYAARIPSNMNIARGYVKSGEEASRQFNELIRKQWFDELENVESRNLVLINYRYMTAIYEGICNDGEINDCTVKQFTNALALLDDPYYRDMMPRDYDWTYYELRILEYIATMTEGNNRRGFSPEQVQFAYECSQRLVKKWDEVPEEYHGYITESAKELYLCQNAYLTGNLDRNAYLARLLELYNARDDKAYAMDDVYMNLLIPIDYLGAIREEEIGERERRIIFDFYRRIIAYAHNTANTGELTQILNYYNVFLTRFIEVSDDFTMEDMCMESFAALHPPTYIHSNMVAQLSRCLCSHLLKKRPELFIGVLGCSNVEEVIQRKQEIISKIYHGALVHDIGKLAITDTVFVYGRNITDEEFQLIRLHPEAGYYLAKGTSIEPYCDIILAHHRFYNEQGGYPPKADDTPLPDKILIDIVTLADCMDAATDVVGRSYAKGKTLDQFHEELLEGAGTRYSPDIVELFADPAVYKDLQYLLTEGREKVYSDTYYLLKNVQQQGEIWDQKEDPIDAFREFLRIKSRYETAIELINFDLETVTPENGITEKAETLATLSLKLKEHLTSADAERLFRQLPKQKIEDEGLQKSFEVMRERFEKQRRIPDDFFESFVKEKALSEKAWEHAKRVNDFSLFEPYLDKMISMTKKQCDYTDPDSEPYDVLLNRYEKGMDRETIDGLFSDMKEGLNSLIDRIEQKPPFDTSLLEGVYDVDAQREVSLLLLDYIGFDRKAGLMAESVHPFTLRISYGDVRITNAYRRDEALNGMFSALHEGGHALFEQGIDEKYRNTEMEHVLWMGLHESQSRFYENILGRNIAFWKPIYPRIQELLPKFKEIDLATFERAINDVRRIMIRIDSDEVTYGLHIILRYEMEKAIFQDQVPTKDLPELWREKSKELLRLDPQTDADGILQDMHWSDGSFGYFPSYLLGNIYSGMLIGAMERELGPLDVLLTHGKVTRITEWLREKIFRHGCMYTAKELIPAICGKEITAEDLLSYFNKKYGRIYGLEQLS